MMGCLDGLRRDDGSSVDSRGPCGPHKVDEMERPIVFLSGIGETPFA